MRVDTDTRRHIVSHYREYADTYNQIWSKLDSVHARFKMATQDEKISYLKLSYINAVISIRTPADRQDEAIARLMAGADLETAMERVNYHTQKQKYMKQSLGESKSWNKIAATLETGDLDAAHKIALEQLKYIGPVKAPFIFAMLGYTEKMCIDGNAIRVLGMDDYPSTTNVQQYEELCQEIRREFPTLSEELDLFHLHWVVFDWQRSTPRNGTTASQSPDQTSSQVTRHDAWFDAILSSVAEIESVVDEIP